MIQYRPEIDGLRAIAVLSVILFHAGFAVFSGGFVGVDVFFVISGYLITSIIVREMNEGRFSIAGFYERRARRILPALFLVSFLSILPAWNLLFPDELKDFSASLAAVATFSANVLFWRSSGYFGQVAEMTPMLHMWSLAVEEQFYIAYPLLLMVAMYFKLRLPLVLLICLLFSFALSVVITADHGSAAFFLLPTRGWELLTGALVALWGSRCLDKCRSDMGRNVLGLFGAALLVFSVLVFDRETSFPGVSAMLPVVGTALIILFSQPGTLLNAALSHRLLVLVGLCSYSAYLFHQPLFVFYRHYIGGHTDAAEAVVLILASLLLGWLSWRFIEAPFRDRKKMSAAFVWKFSSVGLLALVCIGLAGVFWKGYEPYWYQGLTDDKQLNFALIDRAAKEKSVAVSGECRVRVSSDFAAAHETVERCYARYGQGVAILGDSHASDLFGSVASANPGERFVIAFSLGGCRAHDRTAGCHYGDLAGFIREHAYAFRLAVYEQAGFYLFERPGFGSSREAITNLAVDAPVEGFEFDVAAVGRVRSYLEELGADLPVVWFGPRLDHHFSLKYFYRNGCARSYSYRPGQEALYRQLDAIISDEMSSSAVKYISQIDAYGFDPQSDFLNCDEVYWSDGDHFSAAGEEFFGRKFDLLRAAQQ